MGPSAVTANRPSSSAVSVESSTDNPLNTATGIGRATISTREVFTRSEIPREMNADAGPDILRRGFITPRLLYFASSACWWGAATLQFMAGKPALGCMDLCLGAAFAALGAAAKSKR